MLTQLCPGGVEVLSQLCPGGVEVLTQLCPTGMEVLTQLCPGGVKVLTHICPGGMEVLTQLTLSMWCGGVNTSLSRWCAGVNTDIHARIGGGTNILTKHIHAKWCPSLRGLIYGPSHEAFRHQRSPCHATNKALPLTSGHPSFKANVTLHKV